MYGRRLLVVLLSVALALTVTAAPIVADAATSKSKSSKKCKKSSKKSSKKKSCKKKKKKKKSPPKAAPKEEMPTVKAKAFLTWTGIERYREQVAPDAFHTTVADPNGVKAYSQTSGLTPGHAYTMWLVFWNHPERCVGMAPEPDLNPHFRCGEPNLFPGLMMGEDGPDLSAVYVDGGVAPANGKLRFSGYIRKGVKLSNPGQTAMGSGVLTNPLGAEYQVSIRTHYEYTGDPTQTTTADGGCTPRCRDFQASGGRVGPMGAASTHFP